MRGGQIYGDWSEGMIAQWMTEGMEAFVARRGGTVVGVLLTSEPHYLKSIPAMRMLETVDVDKEYFVYGPVCVSADARGAGILSKLWEAVRAFYGARHAVLFIERNNAASLSAHAKLGMVRHAEFEAAGREYVTFVSDEPSETDDRLRG